jgi:glycosyltransferase involved in cell wall biosynthesis
MRILLACEFYYPSVGGVQEVMRQVAERLAARGHRVTVATSCLAERKSRELNGVTIVEFKVSGNAVRGMSGDIESYRRYVLENDYDVLMIKAAQQWTFDALLPVLDQIGKPKVFIPCGFSGLYEPEYDGYYREMPEVLGKFDHLIFYASHYRDINMARNHGLSNLSIVPNGASESEFGVPRDPAFRLRLGIDEQSFVVLTVGTFTGDMKGHRELADSFALARFDQRPAVLILNGNVIPRRSQGGVRALLRAPVSNLRRGARRLRGLVRGMPAPRGDTREPIAVLVARINQAAPGQGALIVDLPRAELIQAYLNSDLFVFASNIEYSPLVLYEAAAAGLPFLTVPVGNSAEIAEWTGGGVVCPAPQDERGYTKVDPAVLAEKITSLAASPEMLATLGHAGRQAWSERFTWDKIVDRYEAIFVDLVGKGAS